MNEFDGLPGTAWSLFAATGELGYYLLYKELTENGGAYGEEPRDKRFD